MSRSERHTHGAQDVRRLQGSGCARRTRGGADPQVVQHDQNRFPFDIFEGDIKCVGQSGHTIEPVTNEISRAKIGKDIPVYFIEHERYFGRDGLYVDTNGDYPDNLDRFSYYCQKVLQLLKSLDLKTDIIHCHDWQAALIPVLLKEKYAQDEFYAHTKTVLTIHNLAFQGVFPKAQYEKLGLESPFASESLAYYDQICFLKAGIVYSDKLTTVSPQYAQEIQTKDFGSGLDPVIRERYDGVTGILNGLDHDIWDPAADAFIAKTYSMNDFDEAKKFGIKITKIEVLEEH